MSKTALLFAGQGSQYVGMGKELYHFSDAAKEIFDKANEVLQEDIKNLSFNGPKEKLNQTINTQPAVFTYNMAVFAALGSPTKNYYGGHSLGEVCAVVASGSIDIETGLKVIKERARLMNEASKRNETSMIAVLSPKQEVVKDIIDSFDELYVSNINTKSQVTVSGTSSQLDEALNVFKEKGIRAVKLDVSGAFHSPFMKEAADKFSDFLKNIDFKDAKVPVLTNFDALPKMSAGDIRESLVKQIEAPVQFVKMMDFLEGKQVNNYIEVGPSKVLTNLVKRSLPNVSTYSTDTVEAISKLANVTC